MAAVEPYAPCPCGSGQKFKWCCHKVEAYADRAQRLFEGGQVAAALDAVEEGLRKDPENAWLLTRKAYYLIKRDEPEAAMEPLRRVLKKHPKHFGALYMMTRLELETGGPAVGVAALQRALAALEPGERKGLAALPQALGTVLASTGSVPAALKHLELTEQLADDPDARGGRSTRLIESNPAISPWQKNPYRPADPPAGLSADAQSRFARALGWAGEGLWASAASAFELLIEDKAAAAAALLNLGLCRLWLAEPGPAVDALRRHIAGLGPSDEAVDLEALCQQVAPPSADDQVEEVQWIWPLRDREALLGSLRDDPRVREEGPGPIDPDDPDSPEVDQFGLLDRPRIGASAGLKPGEIPLFVGRLLVGREVVALESYDDGRLDALADRFTATAGAAIAPAHPKTKVLGKVSRSTIAVAYEWDLPEDLDRDEAARLHREQWGRMVREVWPKTPMPYLGGRSPLDAAAAGKSEVPLRAAIFQLETARDPGRIDVDFAALRSTLKVGPEPAIDPETVDVDRVHVARLGLVPIERLDDGRLVAIYRRGKRMSQFGVVERAARALIDRPSAASAAGLEPIEYYSDYVVTLAGGGRMDEAFEWLRRARQADPAADRARNAPTWDMLELRLRMRSEEPGRWVPELAVVLDRYGDNPEANQTIMLALVDLGLIRLVPGPEGADDIMLDPRPLEALMSQYGPRVTTASGQLGVAATRGEIWTPGAAAAGGAIWTPGSGSPAPASAAGGEKPKLIIPGR